MPAPLYARMWDPPARPHRRLRAVRGHLRAVRSPARPHGLGTFGGSTPGMFLEVVRWVAWGRADCRTEEALPRNQRPTVGFGREFAPQAPCFVRKMAWCVRACPKLAVSRNMWRQKCQFGPSPNCGRRHQAKFPGDPSSWKSGCDSPNNFLGRPNTQTARAPPTHGGAPLSCECCGRRTRPANVTGRHAPTTGAATTPGLGPRAR